MKKSEFVYKIEYGIKPTPKKKAERAGKYPFAGLSKPNASFFVPESHATAEAIRSAAAYYKQSRPEFSASVLAHTKDGVKGHLVMRKVKKGK